MKIITTLLATALLSLSPQASLLGAAYEGVLAVTTQTVVSQQAQSTAEQEPAVGTDHRVEVAPDSSQTCYVDGILTDCATSYEIQPTPAPQANGTDETTAAPIEATDEEADSAPRVGGSSRVALNEDGTWTCTIDNVVTNTSAVTPTDCFVGV